jgi:hypothetical protein
MNAKYREDLRAARAKLIQMINASESLQQEIAKQKQVVAALTKLAELTAPTNLVAGVTDAVRNVLKVADGKLLSPAEIQQQVQSLGVPPQQNLLASIHTTLRRLAEAGEAEYVQDNFFANSGWRIKRETLVGLIESLTREFK